MNMPIEFPEESTSDTPLAEPHAPLTSATVSPLTVLRFLVGNRQAILDIARSRNAVWLGGTLVLSAAFAREYDGEDLLREPWHLVIPHAASLVTCFLLYCMVRLVAMRRKADLPRFTPGFGIFLGLYWLTAPLAWVYAIPFERWNSPGDATQLNLLLLGLVAFWRVVLIIRAIQVAFGAKTTFDITMTVLLFGDAVMLTALRLVPVPLLQLMGGVRLTESESVMQSTVVLLTIGGVIGIPLFLIGYAMAFQRTPQWEPPAIEPTGKISVSTWIIAALTILVWGLVLPMTQPEQQLRWQVEYDLQAGRISEALQSISEHDRSDFPPHWDPPPHVALQQHSPHIADVVAMVVAEKPADWVRQLYLDKFKRKFANVFSPYSSASEQERSRYLMVLPELPIETWYPEDEWKAEQFRTVLEELWNNVDSQYGPETRKLANETLLRLPEKTPPDIPPLEDAPTLVSEPAEVESTSE